jgi:protein-tyrosine phosphatase
VPDWAPNFHWIQPDLAVGGSFPIEQAPALASEHGIHAVIDVRAEGCDDRDAMQACGLAFLHLPTQDMHGVSQPMLDIGVGFARDVAAARRKLLVHCEHGIGRSATVALCILVDRGFAPLDALKLAKDARALISPSRMQHQAWVDWIARHRPGAAAPSYHEFGIIAYRHLAAQG